MRAVCRSGETNKKKISIYKEATPTDADTDIEGVTKKEKENTKNIVDAIVFGYTNKKLIVLLIKRWIFVRY